MTLTIFLFVSCVLLTIEVLSTLAYGSRFSEWE